MAGKECDSQPAIRQIILHVCDIVRYEKDVLQVLSSKRHRVLGTIDADLFDNGSFAAKSKYHI